MTFLSAVSGLILLSSGSAVQDGLANPLSRSQAVAAAPSTLTLSQYGIVLGQAVVISDKGLAMTTGDVAFNPDGTPREKLEATQFQKQKAAVSVEAFDPVTDLALLRVSSARGGGFTSAKLSSATPKGAVLVMLPSGPSRAEVTRNRVNGVMAFSRRYLPLVELRMEREWTAMGGAPVFSPDGTLSGLLVASLIPEEVKTQNADKAELSRGAALAQSPQAQQYGPRPVATTFSLGVPVLQRVIEGFVKNNGHVQHPWIGIFFTTNPEGGILVTKVTPDSPAAAAGIQVGDLVHVAGDRPTPTPLDLGAHLFDLQVGSKVDIMISRSGVASFVTVSVIADPRTVPGGPLRRTPIKNDAP